jgi:hypothetical protein
MLLLLVHIFIHYTWTFKKFPKSIKLTEHTDIVRINGALCGFKSKYYAPYERIEEISDEDWDRHMFKIFGPKINNL